MLTSFNLIKILIQLKLIKEISVSYINELFIIYK